MHTKKNRKNPCDLDLWPMTLIFNRPLEVVKVHVRAEFQQAKFSGSWVIVLTEKLGDDADNNTAVASAGSKKCGADLWLWAFATIKMLKRNWEYITATECCASSDSNKQATCTTVYIYNRRHSFKDSGYNLSLMKMTKLFDCTFVNRRKVQNTQIHNLYDRIIYSSHQI